jgi:hypothetical protein
VKERKIEKNTEKLFALPLILEEGDEVEDNKLFVSSLFDKLLEPL